MHYQVEMRENDKIYIYIFRGKKKQQTRIVLDVKVVPES